MSEFGLLGQFNRIQNDPTAKANLDTVLDQQARKVKPTSGARKEFDAYIAENYGGQVPDSLKSISDSLQKGYGVTDAHIGDALFDDAKARKAATGRANPTASAISPMLGNGGDAFNGTTSSPDSAARQTADIQPFGLEQSDKQQVSRVLLGAPKGVTNAALTAQAQDEQRYLASVNSGLGIFGSIITALAAGLGGPGVGAFVGSTFGRQGDGVLGSVKGGLQGFGAGGGFDDLLASVPGTGGALDYDTLSAGSDAVSTLKTLLGGGSATTAQQRPAGLGVGSSGGGSVSAVNSTTAGRQAGRAPGAPPVEGNVSTGTDLTRRRRGAALGAATGENMLLGA